MSAESGRPQTGRLKVRWGKLSIAVIGALALVSVPVFLVFAILTSLPWWLPFAGLAVALLSVLTLRTWAVQERRQEAWQNAAERVAAQQASQQQEDTHAVSEQASEPTVAESDQGGSADAETEQVATAPDARETTAVESDEHEEHQEHQEQEAQQDEKADSGDVPFDVTGQGSVPVEDASEEDPVADSPHEVTDASADDDEEEAGAGGERSEQAQRVAEAAKAGQSWEPRQIPAPGYAVKAETERSQAAPFQAETEKKPEDVRSIRASERERAEGARRARDLNLDGILSRRRA